jgi:hypothetical protein
MGLRRVEVEIQELVLHGFAGIDGAAVAASVERALRSRLAHTSASFGESRTFERVETPAIELGALATPRMLGGAVADRVHGSLRP